MAMKEITQVGLMVGILFTGCGVDKKNYEKVGKAIVRAATSNDTTFLSKELFSDNVKGKKWMFASLNQLKGKKYTYLKSDTLSIGSSPFFPKMERYISSYFKIDSSYYALNSFYDMDSEGNISINSFLIHDLSKECSDWINNPYSPLVGIEFKRIIWKTDHTKMTFTSGKIELVNDLGEDIEFIKFRVVLINRDAIFFNQTITHYGKIYKGDASIVDIPGMSNFFTGFDLEDDQVKLNFTGEVIEVLPKPERAECKTLSDIKKYELDID